MDPSEERLSGRGIKSEDKNNNNPPNSSSGGGDANPVPIPSPGGPSSSGVKDVEKSPLCIVPTINFTHFVSLLSPNNVENCLCCSTSLLLNSGPPPLLAQRKGEILKSFCDILNLPFNPPSRRQSDPGGEEVEQKSERVADGQQDDMDQQEDEEDGDEDESFVDFPFCRFCTKEKVLLLTMAHEKLEALQAQFDQLKETIMKDVVRGFVTNIVVDKKIPVQLVREARICERMFHLFKGHSERKVRKDMVDSETQTDISSVFTPLMNPSAVASLLENASSSPSGPPFNKRRKTGFRKSESISSGSNCSNFKTWNHRHSPSSSTNLNTSRARLDYSPVKNTQTVIEESIVPFDEHLNGDGMYPFDDNGILSMGGDSEDTYMPSADYYNLSKPNYVPNLCVNGFSTIDDQFQNNLGLSERYDVGEIGNEFVAVPRTSPLIYTDLDSVSMEEKSQAYSDTGSRKKYARCEVCDKTMLKCTIKMHMEQIHGDERPYKCRGCDRRFARRDHFNCHEEHHIVNSKKGYFCHRCVDKDEIITGKSAYVAHCINVHGVEDDVVEYFYFCDKEDCKNSYKVREDFTNHVKSHWMLGEFNNCGTCDKIFADKNRLIAHEAEAHATRNSYDCQFCHMVFQEEQDFSRHLSFHKVKIPDELQYQCEKCSRRFETQNRLRRHIYTTHVRVRSKVGKSRVSKSNKLLDHDEDSSIVQNDEDDENGVKDSDNESNVMDKPKPDYPCEECGKSYTTEKKLMKHVQKHRTEGKSKSRKKVDAGLSSDDDVLDAGEVNADKEDEDYPSPGLSKRKRRRSNHKTPQIKSSTLRIACEFCALKWKTSIDLRRHLVRSHRQEHLKGSQAFCVVCFVVFSNQQELDDHCQDKHSKSKCSVCNKQLQSTGLLKQHMERHKAHPFICKVCDHGFASESNLKKHTTKSHPKRKNTNGGSNSPVESLQFHDQNSIDFDLDSIDLFQI